MQLQGHRLDLDFETVEAILEATQAQSPCHRNLPAEGAVQPYIRYQPDSVILGRSEPKAAPFVWQEALNLPGTTILPGGERRLIAQRFAEGTTLPSELVEHNSAERETERACALLLPCSGLEEPLVARSWRHGDRMRPRGLHGSKKLQDLFTDARIPSSQRGFYPVLAEREGEGIIRAVCGLRLAEGVFAPQERADTPLEAPMWLLRLISV
jgi:tRNA(Ile)-lysidine synthetase-like protein